MRFDELLKAATTRVETVRVVRTAINPLLWLVGIVTPLSLILAVFASETWLRVGLLTIGSFPILAATLAYIAFMIRDPDRLQSEEYRLRHQALKMLYRKGASAEKIDAAKEIAQMDTLPSGFSKEDER